VHERPPVQLPVHIEVALLERQAAMLAIMAEAAGEPLE
jgi:hypothetical protein